MPVEPVTSQAVEDAIKAALQNQPDRVHGQPLRVKCCQVKKKKGHAFQLRCDLCQHGTCSWRDTATCKPGQCMVESSYLVKSTHGRPKQAKGPAGRKSRASARSFTINETVAYESQVTQQRMWQAVQKYVENRTLDRTLLVRSKPCKQSKKGPKCNFYCRTHQHRETKERCKRAGSACIQTLPDETRQLCLRYQSDDMHAPHERQPFGTLTWRQGQAA